MAKCDISVIQNALGIQQTGPRTVIVPADPIIWSADTSYEYLTLVATTDFGQAYISKRDVPAGTPLTNTTYWIPAAMYNAQLADIQKNLAKITDEIPKLYAFVTLSDYISGTSADNKILILEASEGEVTITGSNVVVVADDVIDYPLSVVNSDSVTFTGIEFTDKVTVTDSNSVSFDGCNFHDISGSGIDIVNNTVGRTHDITIRNCTFTNVNTSEADSAGAIRLDGYGPLNPGDMVSVDKQPYNLNVSDNTFINCGRAACFMGGVNNSIFSDNYVDQNNTSYNSTMGLITLTRKSNNVIVCNNVINHTKYEGIIVSNSYNIQISDNVVNNARFCIAIENGSYDVEVMDNVCYVDPDDPIISLVANHTTYTVSNSNNVRFVNCIDNTETGNSAYLNGECSDISYERCKFNTIINVSPNNSNLSFYDNVIDNLAVNINQGFIDIVGNKCSGINLNIDTLKADTFVRCVSNLVNDDYAIRMTTPDNRNYLHLLLGDNISNGSDLYKVQALDIPIEIVGKVTFDAQGCYNVIDTPHVIYIDGDSSIFNGELLKYSQYGVGNILMCNDGAFIVTVAGNPSEGTPISLKGLAGA